jgi:hypothetical protein
MRPSVPIAPPSCRKVRVSLAPILLSRVLLTEHTEKRSIAPLSGSPPKPYAFLCHGPLSLASVANVASILCNQCYL